MTRDGRRSRATVAVLVAATLVAPIPGPLAGWSSGEFTSSPQAEAATDDPHLVLVDQTFVVPMDGTLDLSFEVRGELAVPPPDEPDGGEPDDLDDGDPDAEADGESDAEADDVENDDEDDDGDRDRIDVVVTSYEPITNRDRVAGVLAGATGPAIDGARFDFAEVFTPTPGPTIDRVGSIELSILTSTRGDVARELELPIAGLYPITVELRRDGRRLTRHTTFVERLAAEGSRPARTNPFGVAVVATIPDPGPEPDRLTLVDARSRLVEIAQLGEDLTAPITVGIPPVVAADLGDNPEFTRRLQDALVGSEIMAVPATLLDPSSAAAADEGDAFTTRLRSGEDALAAIFPATPVRRTAWRWETAVSADGALLLRDLGVQLLVMPLADYHELGNALPPEFTDSTLLYTSVLPGGSTMAVAVVEPVSRLLDPETDDPRSATERAVELFASLVASRLQLPDAPRSAVLSTSELSIPDADVLAALESFVDEHPAFRFQTLSLLPNSTATMFVGGPRRDVDLPTSAGMDLRGRSDRIDLARVLVDSYSSLLPPDDPRPTEWYGELELMLSTGFTDGVADERIDAVIGAVERVPDVIVPPEPFTFTLTGSSSEITLRLRNTGQVPVRVAIDSEASKLTFPEGRVETVLEPGINDLTIPVNVLSNGTFPVTIQLVTPLDQRPVGDPLVLTARVNAITGLGQVLTGGALLVLASWWYSHFRSRRRQHAQRARRNHPSNGGAGHDDGHDDARHPHDDAHDTGSVVRP